MQTLQKAKSAYSNYRTDYDKVNQFLCNIPSYEPQETDNIQQVEMKLKSQAVIPRAARAPQGEEREQC